MSVTPKLIVAPAAAVRSMPFVPGWNICTVPKLLIVSPPPCVAGPGGEPAGGRDIGQSLRLAPLYRKLAAELGHAFFDAGSVACASPVDGVHLDAPATAAIGRALAAPVREILG